MLAHPRRVKKFRRPCAKSRGSLVNQNQVAETALRLPLLERAALQLSVRFLHGPLALAGVLQSTNFSYPLLRTPSSCGLRAVCDFGVAISVRINTVRRTIKAPKRYLAQMLALNRPVAALQSLKDALAAVTAYCDALAD